MQTKRFCHICILLSLCLFFSCKKKQEEPVYDFQQIKDKGELTIITLNTSTSYFIYKEEPMGYDYDLAQDFCEHHGLKLNVKVAESTTKLIEMLNRGEGDLVAFTIPVLNELKDSVAYCGLQRITHQVLVQQANRGDTILKDVTDIIGKEVYVESGTKYHQRLLNLDAEMGGGIRIHTVSEDTITSEDLIEEVAIGKIKYTIADEYVARLNRTYYRNIDISLSISFDQRSSWAVRKNTPELAKALNDWFTENGNTPVYRSITKKYFELSKQLFEGDYEIPRDLPKGAISVYDDLFKKHAAGTQYEWQFLAAICYQESRFQNNLTSWAGAAGIMGLMPRTAASLGLSADDRMNPDLSIGAAVELLDRLNKIFRRISDMSEREKFILAAYNGGNGHINDAQALAEKYGANPYVWEDNVEKYLALKSNPEYYNDPVCRNGYFRGGETLRYVGSVLSTMERFKKISN
ncbi:membrane-bound lytic murein transglycosylase F [Dysgonomonas sp. PFB1-18]|uniref:transglycosylase SLT domain-containing protein n=1 Tax=unclassified Dysgonomonas TaxID=2630389 RepID=UPI0024739991|nr:MULTISPECIES: transporter substrate-binding domain-containing protein [unclassified Dysgonomonas]MDH6307281.1 membrane-bound lytic murein transglycosylase F [Dysgonomonas sp. PF1-14]MDH6337199.1 membrane-bound lytic murein transglycosylase F [Dysgonomonas sp. PF1-16]MDH6379123.1 membrane-bound lytic murein transglycosylase F [Dysgonomonas sp. PFB1-18]MDH6396240.1 membrane-bound lytic murein transglycosylase F [Dysgonomonas sp. PF1-23]